MSESQLRRESEPDIIDQVDELNEEVKVLALNLAVYLAKAKSRSETLSRLEPEFIRLVNSSVKVVQELAGVISAARNLEMIDGEITVGSARKDPLEVRLRLILEQCSRIMYQLTTSSESESREAE